MLTNNFTMFELFLYSTGLWKMKTHSLVGITDVRKTTFPSNIWGTFTRHYFNYIKVDQCWYNHRLVYLISIVKLFWFSKYHVTNYNTTLWWIWIYTKDLNCFKRPCCLCMFYQLFDYFLQWTLPWWDLFISRSPSLWQ